MFNAVAGRLDLPSFLPEIVCLFGEERWLIPRTAAGYRAYVAGCLLLFQHVLHLIRDDIF